ncbi:MAG: DUF3843 family protein [Bacteroidales bacterium]|nr:DUF3843 family protein [Bacteroidales bacterium]
MQNYKFFSAYQWSKFGGVLHFLPDAALTSLKGYEHGRELVQQNSQFMADYFFSQHR